MRASIALLLLLASSSAAAACSPLLAHTLPNLTDQATSLCQFQGKVLLVVEGKQIAIALGDIDRARLVPDV